MLFSWLLMAIFWVKEVRYFLCLCCLKLARFELLCYCCCSGVPVPTMIGWSAMDGDWISRGVSYISAVSFDETTIFDELTGTASEVDGLLWFEAAVVNTMAWSPPWLLSKSWAVS